MTEKTEKQSFGKWLMSSPAKRQKYTPAMFGTAKAGSISLGGDGRMTFFDPKQFKNPKWHADDIADIAIEDGAAVSQRATVGRTGGGAIAGGILFGPLGALAGGVIGASAKKTEGGEKFLTIALKDGRVFFVEVANKDYAKARQMIHALESARAADAD